MAEGLLADQRADDGALLRRATARRRRRALLAALPLLRRREERLVEEQPQRVQLRAGTRRGWAGRRGGGRMAGSGWVEAHCGLMLEAIVESDGDAALGGGADELARKGLAVEGGGEESDEAKPGAEL